MTQTISSTTESKTELAEASTDSPMASLLMPSDTFVRRHVGPNADEIKAMLAFLGLDSLDDLVDKTVPASIRLKKPLKLGEPRASL